MNISLRKSTPVMQFQGTWWIHKNQIILKYQDQGQTDNKTMKIIIRSHNFWTGSRRDFWLAAN